MMRIAFFRAVWATTRSRPADDIPKSNHALFTYRVIRIETSLRQRIMEYGSSFVKRYLMLDKIRSRFQRIPFELHDRTLRALSGAALHAGDVFGNNVAGLRMEL